METMESIFFSSVMNPSSSAKQDTSEQAAYLYAVSKRDPTTCCQ